MCKVYKDTVRPQHGMYRRPPAMVAIGTSHRCIVPWTWALSMRVPTMIYSHHCSWPSNRICAMLNMHHDACEPRPLIPAATRRQNFEYTKCGQALTTSGTQFNYCHVFLSIQHASISTSRIDISRRISDDSEGREPSARHGRTR